MLVGYRYTMEEKAVCILSKKETLPKLLREYNYLKRTSLSKKQFVNSFQATKNEIDKDIPRSFPKSKWVSKPENVHKIYEVFRCFLVRHHNIGYLQGMLLILIPLLRLYHNQEYLAFWSFVKITNLFKPLYYPLIFKDPENWFTCSYVDQVIDLWMQFRKVRVSTEMKDMIYQLLHWKFMSTLFFSLIGTNLNNMNILVNYFIKHINNECVFKRKKCAFGLGLLLCFFKDETVTIEQVQSLSTCYLTEDALKTVVACAHDVEVFFGNV